MDQRQVLALVVVVLPLELVDSSHRLQAVRPIHPYLFLQQVEVVLELVSGRAPLVPRDRLLELLAEPVLELVQGRQGLVHCPSLQIGLVAPAVALLQAVNHQTLLNNLAPAILAWALCPSLRLHNHLDNSQQPLTNLISV